MSIFALALILATTLIRRSFVASSAATSSPSCPASSSLSDSLTSPTPVVRLYFISTSTSLEHMLCISLSMVGFGTCVPLSPGISLSSRGSGVFLSLLLDGMVNLSFPCYRKNDADTPRPSGRSLLTGSFFIFFESGSTLLIPS
jgi:hypothetical protein